VGLLTCMSEHCRGDQIQDSVPVPLQGQGTRGRLAHAARISRTRCSLGRSCSRSRSCRSTRSPLASRGLDARWAAAARSLAAAAPHARRSHLADSMLAGPQLLAASQLPLHTHAARISRTRCSLRRRGSRTRSGLAGLGLADSHRSDEERPKTAGGRPKPTGAGNEATRSRTRECKTDLRTG